MFTCHVCSKVFKRGDNLSRHLRTVHADLQPVEMTDEDDSADEDVASDAADDQESDDLDVEDETDIDEQEDMEDPWKMLVEDAFDKCQFEFDERVNAYMTAHGVDQGNARERIYRNMLPAFRKAMADAFVNVILWFHAMQKEPIYLSIKKTVSNLKYMDDYNTEEAWKSAAKTRKFLFDGILKKYEPPEITNAETDDEDVDGTDTANEKETNVPRIQKGRGIVNTKKSITVPLISNAEQVNLMAKSQLLRAGQKRGYDGFTPEDTALMEAVVKQSRRAPSSVNSLG